MHASRILAMGLFVGCVLEPMGQIARAGNSEFEVITRAPVEDGTIVGVSVAVLRGDIVVHASAHGMADLDHSVAMSIETPLRVASVSKTVTAAVALRLSEQGRLDLDAPLTRWIPELEDVVSAEATFCRALSHTSGLADYLAEAYARPEIEKNPLTPSFVIDVVRRSNSVFEPGTNWGYSNTGFTLAALAMSRATQRPWHELVDELVALPLGLGSLTSCDPLIDHAELRGYRRSDATTVSDPYYVEEGVFGDGGLCATATDPARLFRGLDQGDFLSPALREQMFAPTLLDDGTRVDYGLGMRLGQMGGARLWGHTGSIGAYVATVFRFPDDDLTVAVVQNTTDADVGALILAWQLSESALGLEPPSFDEVVEVEHPSLPADFVNFGEESEPTRTRVAVIDGELQISFADDPTRTSSYQPLGPRVFVPRDWPRDRIRLHVRDGQVTGYSVYYAGMFVRYFGRVTGERSSANE